MGEMDAQGEGFCEGPSEKGNLLSHTKEITWRLAWTLPAVRTNMRQLYPF